MNSEANNKSNQDGGNSTSDVSQEGWKNLSQDNPSPVVEWDEATLCQLLEFNECDKENATTQNVDKSPADEECKDTENVPSQTSSQTTDNVVSQSELFDDPRKNKTKVSFYAHPIVKSLAVGTAIGAVFFTIALILSGVLNIETNTTPQVTESPVDEDAVALDNEQEESETGKLKAELALGRQAEQIKQVEKNKSLKPSSDSDNSTKESIPPSPPKAQPKPQNLQKSPVAFSRTRPRKLAQSLNYRPHYKPRIAVPHLPTRRAISTSINTKSRNQTPISRSRIIPKKQNINFSEKLLAVNRLGSYGRVKIASVPNVLEDKTIAKPSPKPQDLPAKTPFQVVPRATPVVFTSRSVSKNQLHTSSSSSTNSYNPSTQRVSKRLAINRASAKTNSKYVKSSKRNVNPYQKQPAYNSDTTEDRTAWKKSKSAAEAIPQNNSDQHIVTEKPPSKHFQSSQKAVPITNTTVRQLRIGMNAEGKIATPMVWVPSKDTPTQFIILLTQPIYNSQAKEVIPSGSKIVCTVKNVDESGYMDIEATNIVVENKEYLLPSGSLAIAKKNSQPLIASKYGRKRRKIKMLDTSTFIFGSLAKVGQVLNQPNQSSSFSSSGIGGSVITSIERRDKNILGAVLEGGFTPLTQQILARNQATTNTLLKRENAWYIPAGVDVRVVVNNSFEF